ncbi:MAG: Gfo/Idh/MocA family oxidoreductase [Pseudomonadota bacterium]
MRIAVLGAGIIGRMHIDTVVRSPGATLTALVDPAPDSARLAATLNVAHFPALEPMLDAGIADAAIIAAPNAAHLPLGRACLEAGLPVLMEKPLAATLAEGRMLADVVSRTGVPLLVGHHRRHHPIIRAAKAAIERGAIGDLVTATVMSILSKPPSYFQGWRIEKGQGGPLLINASHEVDLLRHFFGEITEVSAMTSHARRGHPVEETAAFVARFASGGIATLTQSDAACGPWAWDVTSGESRGRFPANDAIAHIYAGTRAGLSLPDLTLWQHPGAPDWADAMERVRLPHGTDDGPEDVYEAQLAHFIAVAQSAVPPLISAEDGLRTMAVLDAIVQAADSGATVAVG